MKKLLTTIGGLIMTISLNGQTDVVEKGFQTSADNVYGVLVGVLVAFGVGALGFFVWVFRKIFGWLEKYRDEKAQGEATKAVTFDNILHELQEMRKTQTETLKNQVKQGEDISEIKEDMEGVKHDVHTLKQDVEKLKSGN